MIEVRFKDIDPDTGGISQDKLVCCCPDEKSSKFVLAAIKNFEAIAGFDPNREYYVEGSKESYGTHRERVWWLFQKYYEAGLEFESLVRNVKEEELDSIKMHDTIVSVPKLSKYLVIK